MKQFMVIGLGNFGANVVRELLKLEGSVTALDIDKARVQSLPEHPQLVAILADATERAVLEKLDVENFDSIIVSTGKDSHASILSTLHLSELKARKIVVKANSQEHAKILTKVGASEAVIPEQQMAIKVAHSLARPNVIDYLPLGQNYDVAELIPPDDFVHKKLIELQLRTRYRLQVIATKDSKTNKFNFILDGGYEIKPNDILVVLGKHEDINKIRA